MSAFARAPFLWTYPEEALLAGPERLAEQVAELGFGGVAVALVYHRARLVMPRHGRVLSLPAGHVAFAPDQTRYEALRPTRTAAPETVRAVQALRAACARRGVAFHAWIVPLHDEALVAALPQAQAQTVAGDPIGRSLCPSHPQTAAYVRALVDDLGAQLGPDGFEVEGAPYPAWEPGYTVTLALEQPAPRAARLGSQCFCRACRERFAAAGEDPDALARETRAAAGPPFAMEAPARGDAAPDDRHLTHRHGGPGDAHPLEAASDGALAARLIPPRAAAVAELLGGAAERARAHGAALRAVLYGDAATVALQGVAPGAVAAADGVVLALGELSGAPLLDQFAALRTLAGEVPAVASLNWSPARTPEALTADVAALARAGAAGVALYNLALAPARALPAFAAGAAAAATRGRSVPPIAAEVR